MRTNRFAVTLEGIEAYLFDQEVNIFSDIAGDLRAIIETPALGEDPVRERLFPRAYLDPTEETAEMTWAAFAHPELLESRVATLIMLTKSLERLEPSPMDRDAGEMKYVVLSPEETESWLKGLNDLRLALGTRLNITEDGQKGESPDPYIQLREIYDWLTFLQQDLLEQVYLS
ncbi:MAG TPA: DUF2017 family protein [Acidimicrobiia bacterium]|nr:DUF2017 family protein [Acidimicrobiia bacterium]